MAKVVISHRLHDDGMAVLEKQERMLSSLILVNRRICCRNFWMPKD